MTGTAHIDEKLRNGQIVLLDGATGTELERRGVPMHSKAWSAEALLSHPQAVRAIHEDYIRAGADVITVNTFSAARHMLIGAALTREFTRMNRDAVQLAIQARENAGKRPVAIAGSIAPTTFCMDPGKCYPPLSEALSWYEEQAQLQVEAGVDLLIIEMIEDLEQGQLAIKAARSTGLPVWLGFSCQRNDSGRIMLWEKENSLADGIKAIAPLGGDAAFIMHTDVTDATEAFSILKEHWPKTLGIYAHSGLFVMPNWQFNDVISPADYADKMGEWIQMGARIIGGCCGIGPDHIRELHRRFIS